MFTSREWEYLEKLEKRNHGLFLESCAGKQPQKERWDPLEKPMNVQERKVRSSIQRKMTLNAKELAYAFLSGMPPEKTLFQRRVITLENMVWLFKGLCWIVSLAKRGSLEEIIETKYCDFNSVYEFFEVGDLIKKEAKGLRDEFRAKNPELYDAVEKKLNEERKRIR